MIARVALGIDLTPNNIVARAEPQSCAGCHQISNNAPLGGGLTWPPSNGFTQINEDGGLSPALRGTFLPARAATLVSFMDSTCSCSVDGGPGTGAGDVLTVGGGTVGSAN